MSFNFSPLVVPSAITFGANVVSNTVTLGRVIAESFTVTFVPLGSDSLITSDGKTFKVKEI